MAKIKKFIYCLVETDLLKFMLQPPFLLLELGVELLLVVVLLLDLGVVELVVAWLKLVNVQLKLSNAKDIKIYLNTLV